MYIYTVYIYISVYIVNCCYFIKYSSCVREENSPKTWPTWHLSLGQTSFCGVTKALDLVAPWMCIPCIPSQPPQPLAASNH